MGFQFLLLYRLSSYSFFLPCLFSLLVFLNQVVEAHLPDQPEQSWAGQQVELLPDIPQQTGAHGPLSCGVGVVMILHDVAKQKCCSPQTSWSFIDADKIRLGLLQKLLYILLY